MLRSKFQRSIIAPLVLGGMLLAWENLWDDLMAWLQGSPMSEVSTSDSSSGIDPNGRPNGANTGAESDYSSGIDPNGRP